MDNTYWNTDIQHGALLYIPPLFGCYFYSFNSFATIPFISSKKTIMM